MKLYISATGIKRLAESSAAAAGDGAGDGGVCRRMKWTASGKRRLSHRTIRLFAGLLLPFLFVRFALLVLESAALCSSPIGCLTWRIFGGSDAALLREELVRALLEATDGGGVGTVDGSNSEPVSFKDLVKDMSLNRQDLKAFAFKTKAMIAKMEHIVKTAQWHESMYWHLAAHSVPKGLHCLSLEMAEEYAVNAAARSRFPLPQYVHRLTDPSFHHVVLLTDNIVAASVVISSALKTSSSPEKLVFHVVTDKKTYTSMHAWFSVNVFDSAVVEVKGLHQYDWPHEVNVAVKEMLEIHHQIWNHNFRSLKEDLEYGNGNHHKIDGLSPSSVSLLNHIRVYLPELFPDLNKVVLLDHDVVVQRDISSLWDLDLNQKVVAAVVDSWCGTGCCPGQKYKDYFNFTNPIISSVLDKNRCGWLYGLNVFDLQRWRNSNITAVYNQWLKLSLNSGFELWHPGALPPALLAFENHVHTLDPSWHVAGLGHRYPLIDNHMLETAAVVHFSGPAKPWLEIGSSEVRDLWTRHINSSNNHIRKCGIVS
ncbi:putative galacturonosyltransferase 15 isoform X4 [Salvia divinorum]|uniref:Hexosyltransferase n=1 Tax=Salvia divinorum TaxID=28513 RepID=A0ABD1HI95_SALDI